MVPGQKAWPKAIAREGPQDRQLQGQDRAGTSRILMPLSPSDTPLPGREHREASRSGRQGLSKAQTGRIPRHGSDCSHPWPGCTLKEEQESTGSKAINLNSGFPETVRRACPPAHRFK